MVPSFTVWCNGRVAHCFVHCQSFSSSWIIFRLHWMSHLHVTCDTFTFQCSLHSNIFFSVLIFLFCQSSCHIFYIAPPSASTSKASVGTVSLVFIVSPVHPLLSTFFLSQFHFYVSFFSISFLPRYLWTILPNIYLFAFVLQLPTTLRLVSLPLQRWEKKDGNINKKNLNVFMNFIIFLGNGDRLRKYYIDK